MSSTDEEKTGGFEYEGTFFPWKVTDKVKDLQLIDHFAKVPPWEFFDLITDARERQRTPIMSAMIATSLRSRWPSWSVERLIRFVEDLSMSDITFIGEDEDESDEDPKEEEGQPLQHSEDAEDTKVSSKKSKERADKTSKTS